MNICYIFDVDGTLTPSRGIIDPQFKTFFDNFCDTHNVYLVTGSDKAKTIEQITESTYNLCKRVYNCSGNEVWEGNNLIRKNIIKKSYLLTEELNSFLKNSKFSLKTGNHIEVRTGLINFSIIGRNATKEDRTKYIEYDKLTNERYNIAKILSEKFDEYNFQVAGETGIDIIKKGCDKAQIISDFDQKKDYIYFYGDTIVPEGNDYPLKIAIDSYQIGKSFNIKNWQDTWTRLRFQK